MREREEVLKEFAEKHSTECNCSDCFESALQWTMDDMADEIVRLREALAAATRDSERLDWLQSQGRDLLWRYADVYGSRDGAPLFMYGVAGRQPKAGVMPFTAIEWRDTVREAIDAAAALEGPRD